MLLLVAALAAVATAQQCDPEVRLSCACRSVALVCAHHRTSRSDSRSQRQRRCSPDGATATSRCGGAAAVAATGLCLAIVAVTSVAAVSISDVCRAAAAVTPRHVVAVAPAGVATVSGGAVCRCRVGPAAQHSSPSHWPYSIVDVVCCCVRVCGASVSTSCRYRSAAPCVFVCRRCCALH
jgi:hypothetical protein